MKKLIFSAVVALIANFGISNADTRDLNCEIPVIENSEIVKDHFEKIPNVAEYGGADYSNAVGIARRITLSEAYEIALNDPEISYFFFTKGFQMVLSCEGGVRIFHYGDAVFFKGEPWWGSAEGLADGYIKKYY